MLSIQKILLLVSLILLVYVVYVLLFLIIIMYNWIYYWYAIKIKWYRVHNYKSYAYLVFSLFVSILNRVAPKCFKLDFYNKIMFKFFISFSYSLLIQQNSRVSVLKNLFIWNWTNPFVSWVPCVFFLFFIQYRSEFLHNFFFKIACATAEEAQRWMEAFLHAKHQVCKNSSKISFIM